MKISHWILLFFGLFMVLCMLILRPVPIVAESECLVVTGKVIKIFEGGTLDACFRIEGDPTVYYINRGLEQGLTLEGLRDSLIGQEITMKYPEYWTPLDPNHTIKHISKLEFQGETLFTELRD
jgi:hypothetical protein